MLLQTAEALRVKQECVSSNRFKGVHQICHNFLFFFDHENIDFYFLI